MNKKEFLTVRKKSSNYYLHKTQVSCLVNKEQKQILIELGEGYASKGLFKLVEDYRKLINSQKEKEN